MNFTTGYILTKAGEALHAKVEAGATLKLTKMQLGSGTVTTVDDYYERSALVEPQNAMSIAEIQQVTAEKNMCVATAVLTNAAVDTSYMASELGLFAQNTDGTEILYAVSYDDHPSYIASKNDGTDITMKFSMYIVATSEITITLTLPKTAEEIATVAAGYAAQAAESELKAKQLEASANNYLQTTQQAMALTNSYADLSKAWAESATSPDSATDTDSPTGYTQSAKIWAALSREYAGLSKFKLPIGYYTSVAEMKASDTAIVNRPCVTLGYYAANDGGGAVYIVRSKTDADTDNGGTIIVLDNSNVAELITPEVVCAEIFGAHGDGVSDDSGALQKMLDYGGNIVLNKNKKYAFSKTLKVSKFSNIDFALAEMTYTGDDIGIIITGEGYASHKSDIGNITNIYLHAPKSNKAISLRRCIKTRITNVRIYDFGKIAISIDASSYEAYLDDIRLVAKVKAGTVGFSGVASDMNFGSLYGLNVETFWSCNGGGYNVDFIHAWCGNLNYYAEGLSTDEYNAWHAQTSLLKIDTNTRANDFFVNFNYIYADTYYNVINWDSYAKNIKINHLGVYGCTKIATFGNTDSTYKYIRYMHINHVTIDTTSLLTDESYYPNISFINGSESKKVINQDINGTTYQFVLNKLKMVVEKFTDTYTLAIKNIELLPYYIGTENYGTISRTRIPYYNETNGNYIYDIKDAGTTEKYIFIPIRILAITFDTKFWYQL